LGSKTDEPLIQGVIEVLDNLSIQHEVVVMSAHRIPQKVMEYGKSARVEVLIAAAGGSTGLPDVLASWTTVPIISISLPTSDLKGVGFLHSLAQMPPGIPVACVAIGTWGARKAAFPICSDILGIKHEGIRQAYDVYRETLKNRR